MSKKEKKIKSSIPPELQVSALSLNSSEFQGFLSVANSNKMKGAKTRYCILQGNNIYIFDDDASKRPRVVIRLEYDVDSIVDFESATKKIFSLSFEGNAVIFFKGVSEEEVNIWIHEVRKKLKSLNDTRARFGAGSRRDEFLLSVRVAEARIPEEIDAYCTVLTDGIQRSRTLTSYSTDNPSFDQDFELNITGETSQVSICLKNDKKKNIFGQISFNISDLDDENPVEGFFPLQDAELINNISGEVHVEVSLAGGGKFLIITVFNAKGLMRVGSGISSPLVRVNINGTIYESIAVKKSSTPTWNFVTEIELPNPAPEMVELQVVDSEKGVFMGKAEITLQEVREASGSNLNTWRPLTNRVVECSDIGHMRVRISYRRARILEDRAYEDFFSLLLKDEMSIPKRLQHIKTPNTKAVSESLVKAFESKKTGVHFIKKIVAYEIESTNDPNIIFRGNTIATKSVDAYMQLTGRGFAKHILQGIIIEVISNEKKSCELDPYRFDPSIKEGKRDKLVQKNVQSLIGYVTQIFNAISDSIDVCCPVAFRNMFESIQANIVGKFPSEEICKFRGIGGFFFLRFFCPAILAPKSYDIIEEHPAPEAARNLTIIAKTLQNIANLVPFGKKEPFMEPVNGFVHDMFDPMKELLDRICIPPSGAIDAITTRNQLRFGREMSIVHYYLNTLYPSLLEQYPDEDIISTELSDTLAIIQSTLENETEYTN